MSLIFLLLYGITSNVSAYRKLYTDCGQNEHDLFVIPNGKITSLFYDTTHLIKNIRNNLLNNKRVLFPSFKFDNFFDKVNVTGGEISWKLSHRVHEKYGKLGVNLRKAPKLQVANKMFLLHLLFYHETTYADI